MEINDFMQQTAGILSAFGRQIRQQNPELYEENLKEIFKWAEQKGIGDELITSVWKASTEKPKPE